MERAYTVKEIDSLRKVCEDRLRYGSSVRDKWPWQSNGNGRICLSLRSPSKREIEEVVRTYMLAGITADDILAEDSK